MDVVDVSTTPLEWKTFSFLEQNLMIKNFKKIIAWCTFYKRKCNYIFIDGTIKGSNIFPYTNYRHPGIALKRRLVNHLAWYVLTLYYGDIYMSQSWKGQILYVSYPQRSIYCNRRFSFNHWYVEKFIKLSFQYNCAIFYDTCIHLSYAGLWMKFLNRLLMIFSRKSLTQFF